MGLGQTRHKWHGVPSVDPSGEVGLGTLHTSFRAVMETSVELPLWVRPRIGDKPGLESRMVSQVMDDTLAWLLLEGCRDT